MTDNGTMYVSSPLGRQPSWEGYERETAGWRSKVAHLHAFKRKQLYLSLGSVHVTI